MADSVTDREKSIRDAKLAEQAERYDEMVEEMSKVAKMGEVLTVEEMSAIFGSAMEDSHFDREKFVHKAEQAKKDRRYDDMIKEMNKLAIMVEKLTENERNLLSVAYENAVVPRMESWRILSFKESRSNAVGPLMESWRNLSFEESRSDVRGINGDKLKLESEIIKICGDILPIIEEHLIPTSSTPVDSLIYYKMKGDCSMYLAELKTGDDKDKYARQSLKAYEAAKSKGAETKLPRAHPYRLGLDLSFSSFFKVVKDWPECVCKMAKEALDEAEDEGNRLDDEKEKKESENIFDKLLLLYSVSLYESQGKEIVVTGAQEASE